MNLETVEVGSFRDVPLAVAKELREGAFQVVDRQTRRAWLPTTRRIGIDSVAGTGFAAHVETLPQGEVVVGVRWR